MSRAIEMKNLVSDIKASTKDRLEFVVATKTATHELLGDIKERIGEIAKDVQHLLGEFDKKAKEMAGDLKHFLDKSEKDRMADFQKLIKDVQANVKEVSHEAKQLVARFRKESGERTDDVKDLLAEYDKALKIMAKELKDFLVTSEDTRLADFDATMKDVQAQVKVAVKDAHEVMEQNLKDIQAIQKDVKDLLDEYAGERKEATLAWQPIRKKGAEVEAVETVKAEVEEALAVPQKRRGRKSKK